MSAPAGGPGERPLRWRPTRHAARVATVCAVALVAPSLVGRPELLAVAAPLLVLLAASGREHTPTQACVVAEVTPLSCLEGEHLDVRVQLRFDAPVDAVTLRLHPTRHLNVAGPPDRTFVSTDEVDVTWRLRALRWGRHQVGDLAVDAVRAGRMSGAGLVVRLGEVRVYPMAPPSSAPLVPTDLLDRIGEHVGRVAGEGMQFAGVRPYAPGDRVRRVHWPSTMRRDRLHLTTFATPRSADVVLAVDAYSDVGSGSGGTLDRSVRGVAGLAAAYLRTADRVGVVAVGGGARWLPASGGSRRWYAIAETLLETRYEPGSPRDLRLPRVALPPGALVILLSPLLDEAAVAAVTSVRERGHPVVVVDVLVEEPVGGRDEASQLALRLWRLDREALAYRLVERGVPVVSWDGVGPVGAVLTPLAHRPLLGRLG